jgi:drug/metabolite transporter (DMT)-like permease
MSPRQRRLLPWIALGVVYVVWGSTYLAIRIAVREVPPMAAACVRFFASGVAMAVIAAVADRKRGWPRWRQIADYALVGVLLLSVANALVMWAEKTIPSGIAALIGGSMPVWLTLLDGVRPGGRHATVRVWLGMLIGLIGVALVARPEGGMASGHWLAILVLQGATVAWAVGSLYAQAIPESDRLSVFTASAIEMLAASAVLAFESVVLFHDDWGAFRAASAHTWLSLSYLAVFGSLVGFTAFAYCLNTLPSATVGTYAYVNPVVAVLLGWLILKEPLSPGLLAGGVLILVAVLITTRARRRDPVPVRGDPSPLTAVENA